MSGFFHVIERAIFDGAFTVFISKLAAWGSATHIAWCLATSDIS